FKRLLGAGQSRQLRPLARVILYKAMLPRAAPRSREDDGAATPRSPHPGVAALRETPTAIPTPAPRPAASARARPAAPRSLLLVADQPGIGARRAPDAPPAPGARDRAAW